MLAENKMDITHFNNDFLLIRSEDKDRLLSLGRAIFQMKYHFVDEVIVSETEICLALNGSFKEEDIKQLSLLETSPKRVIEEVEIPVFFDDHEDWNEVQRISGLTKDEVVKRITETRLTVQMFGFLPGFVYLDGLHQDLHIARKASPSKYVEANSFAIGGQYLGFYPVDSPGGWHIIGKTPLNVLEVNKLPPVALNLGDVVKIIAIDKGGYDRMKE